MQNTPCDLCGEVLSEKSALEPIREFLRKGISMERLETPAKYGFFSSEEAKYGYKSPTSWDELCELTHEGWHIKNLLEFQIGFMEALKDCVEILSKEKL